MRRHCLRSCLIAIFVTIDSLLARGCCCGEGLFVAEDTLVVVDVVVARPWHGAQCCISWLLQMCTMWITLNQKPVTTLSQDWSRELNHQLTWEHSTVSLEIGRWSRRSHSSRSSFIVERASQALRTEESSVRRRRCTDSDSAVHFQPSTTAHCLHSVVVGGLLLIFTVVYLEERTKVN